MKQTVLGVIALLLSGCVPNSFKEHQEFLRTEVYGNEKIHSEFIRQDGFQLHYRSAGTGAQAVAVWIHGTPGGWSDIGRLLANTEFTNQVRLVSIDRPGWGSSQHADEPRLVTDFDEISGYLGPLFSRLKNEYPDRPLILAGHSWGGSLVPALAADFPDLIDGVIVLAGGLDPKLTKPRWYNRAAGTYFVSRIIGDGLRAANVEIYALSDQLAARTEELATLPMPVLVIQGDKDKLVSPKNADFAERSFNPDRSRVIRLKGEGHLLQIERTDLIAQCVLAMANNDLEACGR